MSSYANCSACDCSVWCMQSASRMKSTGLVEALHGGFVGKTDAVIDEGFQRLLHSFLEWV